jgi:hypothetical protein
MPFSLVDSFMTFKIATEVDPNHADAYFNMGTGDSNAGINRLLLYFIHVCMHKYMYICNKKVSRLFLRIISAVLQQMRRHDEAIPAFEISAELDKSSGSALVCFVMAKMMMIYLLLLLLLLIMMVIF